MHAFVEEPSASRCDCAVQSLSWMGRTPDGQPENGAWRLNEANYYHQGWLASGNIRGIIGITFTACQSKNADQPPRNNFYLRGHRSEVILVKWNEPYQKLATCDITGIIFVWIKHDGRWSIELINDRSSQVTDFCWSHDGQMALICYKDSFVLVGSVAGQRYWSSMLNLDGCMVTCGIWTPDDQRVMFGTTAGKVIVMSASGAMVAQVIIHEGLEIVHLGWSSERFHLVEQDSSVDGTNNSNDLGSLRGTKPYILSVVLSVGDVLLMSSYDDVCPKVIHTGLTGVKMEWSNDGELLAVGGHVRLSNQECRNELRFYRRSSRLQYVLTLPSQGHPVTALTWGHNDKRVFVAVGCEIFTVWVIKNVATLQLLCQRCVQKHLPDEKLVPMLPLPTKMQSTLIELFSPTVKGYIPHPGKLREFVCTPPPWKDRLHCTIIRHGDETSGGYYTLYLEHLGGLIPLLKGKRASKLHPDFVIFDPQERTGHKTEDDNVVVNSDSLLEDSDSDSNAKDGCGSPSAQRKKRFRRLRDSLKCRESASTEQPTEEMTYDDSLPELSHLVAITSNIWGTKFRFNGLVPFLPNELGSVTYKTSLLHLQPRQMTIGIVELSTDLQAQSNDLEYNAGILSESEDEHYGNGCDGDLCCTGSSSNFILPPSSSAAAAAAVPSPPTSAAESLEGCSSSISVVIADGNGAVSPTIVKSKLKPCSQDGGSLRGAKHPAGSLSPLLTNVAPLGGGGGSLHKNVQSERLTRISPTEVNPYIECLLNDRRPISGGAGAAGGQCHRLSSTMATIARDNHSRLSSSSVAGGNSGCTARAVVVDDGPMIPSVFLRSVLNGINGSTKTGHSFSSFSPSSSPSPSPSSSTSAKTASAAGQQQEAEEQTGRASATATKKENGTRVVVGNRPLSVVKAVAATTVPVGDAMPRWADKACHDIQFIDDDFDDRCDLYERQCNSRDAIHCSAGASGMSAREIMQSTNALADLPSSLVVVSSAAAQKTVVTLEPSRKSGDDNSCVHGSGTEGSTESFRNDFGRTEVSSGVGVGGACQCGHQAPSHRSEFVVGGGGGGGANTEMSSCGGNHPHSMVIADVPPSSSPSSCPFEPHKTRLILTNSPESKPRSSSKLREMARNALCNNRSIDKLRGKRRGGLCGIANPALPVGGGGTDDAGSGAVKSSDSSNPNSPVLPHRIHQQRCGSLDGRHSGAAAASDGVGADGFAPVPAPSATQSTSLPASPVHRLSNKKQSKGNKGQLAGRSRLQSPLTRKRLKNGSNPIDSSDDEHATMSAEEITTSENYRNLETFQKAQLNKKLRKVRTKCDSDLVPEPSSCHTTPYSSPQHANLSSPAKRPKRKHFVMYNKAPMWNESSQVYQLDFGGRVTQESAKNFQIEFGGKQVMQFGRIDNNAYTLDFQYPYSAIQAFAVALANVTQRLK